MSLSPEQRSEASRLQRRGLTLREIARAIGAGYEDVCLWLYGGVADWAPPAVNSQAKATGAKPPAGTEPKADRVASRPRAAAESAQAGEQQPMAAPALTAPPSEGHEGQDTQERMPESDGRSEGSVSPLQRSSGAGAQLPDSLQAEPESSHPAGAPSNPWDAERERLAAEHPAAQRYFLKSPDGQFLHESTRVLTRMPRFYWRGTAEQLRALREKEPSWPTLIPVPCV